MSFSDNSTFIDYEVLVGTPRTRVRQIFDRPSLTTNKRNSFSGFQQDDELSLIMATNRSHSDSFIDRIANILHPDSHTSEESLEMAQNIPKSSSEVEDALARLQICLDNNTPSMESKNAPKIDTIIISDDEIDVDAHPKYEDITADASLVFDDTLDDINRFLAGESLEEDTKIASKNPQPPIEQHFSPQRAVLTPKNTNTPVEPFKIPPNTCKTRKKFFNSPAKPFDNIQSPIACYIRRNGTIPKPSSCPAKKFKTPEVVKKSNDRFKAIQSPIGLYIKHSAQPALKRNVKTVHNQRLPAELFEDVCEVDEHFLRHFIIPQTRYKPATLAESVVAPVKLPANIKALVPGIDTVTVIQHNARIVQKPSSNESIAFALENDSDLTMKALEKSDDVSFVCRKPIY